MDAPGRSGADFGFDRVLESLADQGLSRRPVTVQRRDATRVVLDGDALVNFCSNDYIGLSTHPRLVAALREAAGRWGVGSTASPLICGRSEVHAELERALAAFTGRARALLFPSGYLANLAVLAGLAGGRGDTLVMDRLCHASLIDGARLSRGRLRRFAHADPEALARRLAGGHEGFCLAVTESVFSMDGDLAPLDEYARLCREAGACLYVDDAHGFGVLGAGGGGALEELQLDQGQVPLLMATFGKALGAAGAFVAGDETLIETLLQRGRPHIYSTAPPPPLAAAVLEALQLLQDEAWRRQRLRGLIERFRTGARDRGLTLLPSATAIQPLLLGDARRATAASEALRRQGYFVAAIRPPTVPEGGARLRITVTAAHDEQDIDGLLDALERTLAEANP